MDKRKSDLVGGTVKKSVGQHFADYITRLIESGQYLTVAEVLRDALRNHELKNKRAKESCHER